MILENQSVNTSGISRRNFLRGMAVGTAALGGAALMGCSAGQAQNTASTESSEEQDTAVETASVATENTDGLYGPQLTGPQAQPIAPVAVPDAWDYEADIIWVGSGGAGHVGPWKAASDGLTNIVIEKNASTGGTTQETNILNVTGSKVQLAAGRPEFDLATALQGAAQTQSLGTRMDRMLIAQYKPFETVCADWMIDNGCDFEVEHECYGIEGLCWKGSEDGGFEVRATKVTLDFVKEQAEALGVQFLTSTPATALVQDETGRIVGVQASQDGKTIYLHGIKGVVLSSGGMEHNKDLLAKYAPSLLRALNATGNTGNTGDGIRMGLGAGAAIAGYDSGMVFDGGMDWNGQWAHYLYAGDVQLVRQPWLNINKQGDRYPYWSLNDYTGFAATMQGCTLMAQPEGHGYVFFDADFEENIKDMNEYMCRRPITPDLAEAGANLDRLPEAIGPHNYMDGVNKALEAGVIKKADTIEELAEQLGFDPNVLNAAVQQWNYFCSEGLDPVFDYKENWLKPIVNPPFYGAAVGGTILSTSTGLKFEGSSMRVIDTLGNPIPGLYCAGCTGGGLSGTNGAGLTGTGAFQSMTGGFIAATYIAENE